MSKKTQVIKEFMQKVQDRAEFVSVDEAWRIIDSENVASMSDICEAALLGEM